jgi:ABC-type multidrug transport system permease subunit
MSALFIGFSFYKQNTSSTGLQNTIFGIFMLVTYDWIPSSSISCFKTDL